MTDRFIFRFLVWLFLASASSWMLLAVFEKSVRIAKAFVADPGFPVMYAGFLLVLVLVAGFIAFAAVVISLSVSWRGLASSDGRRTAYGARCRSSGITWGWVVRPTEVGGCPGPQR